MLCECNCTVRSKVGIGWRRRSFRWRGIDHELEALLGRWQLRDVVFWMSSANVLLHRAIAFFLHRKSLLPRWSGEIGRKCSEASRGGKQIKQTQQSRNTHAEATLATAGAILISQWTDDFIVCVRDREGRCQRGSRRHRQRRPHHAQACRLDSGIAIALKLVSIDGDDGRKASHALKVVITAARGEVRLCQREE